MFKIKSLLVSFEQLLIQPVLLESKNNVAHCKQLVLLVQYKQSDIFPEVEWHLNPTSS